jgi:hypothetical protein
MYAEEKLKERAIPLRTHVYIRAVATAWTRYRQEWVLFTCILLPGINFLE